MAEQQNTVIEYPVGLSEIPFASFLQIEKYSYDEAQKKCIIKPNSDDEKMKPFVDKLNYNLGILKKFSDWTIDKIKTNKDDVSAAANDYLKTLGYISLAFSWIKVLTVSFKDFEENKKFHEDKINTAKFYFEKVLPRAEQHYKSAISGSSNIMNFKFN